MGMKSRRKGYEYERTIVNALRDHGFAAERCPLSGGARTKSVSGYDVSLPLLGLDRRVEVKIRARGFGQLYDWLAGEGVEMLMVRRDRSEPLVVLPWKLALQLMTTAESKKNEA